MIPPYILAYRVIPIVMVSAPSLLVTYYYYVLGSLMGPSTPIDRGSDGVITPLRRVMTGLGPLPRGHNPRLCPYVMTPFWS